MSELHGIRARMQGKHDLVRGLGVRSIWSRFSSPRAEVHLSPSMSRPNLFAGD